MRKTVLTILQAIVFILTILFWQWLLKQSLSPRMNALCILGTVLLVFPTVWLGRRLLDRNPTPGQVDWVAMVVHAILILLFGVAIVKAVQTGSTWRGWLIPLPQNIGLVLVWITAAATLLTVANLALRGLGAPFAIALSRRLATDWMYTYTRNPMVLATLACLLATGLWLQSALFVAWVLALVTSAWIAFLKVFEERELEIRFGESYLAYRAKTPFLLPGKPKA